MGAALLPEGRTCLLCRSPMAERTFTIHRACYRHCAGCGSYRRETVEVSRLQTREYSDHYGNREEVRAAARERRLIWPMLLARIEAAMGAEDMGARPRRLLDVGCGFGDFLALARERGWEVEGIEVNSAMRKACLDAGLEARATPIQEHPPIERPFDVITYLNVLDSLETPTLELVTVRRFLTGGGDLWIRVPNGALHGMFLRGVSGFRGLAERWVQWGVSPLNTWLFTEEGLRRALGHAGFEQVEVTAAAIPHQSMAQRGIEATLRMAGKAFGGRVWSSSLLARARNPNQEYV